MKTEHGRKLAGIAAMGVILLLVVGALVLVALSASLGISHSVGARIAG